MKKITHIRKTNQIRAIFALAKVSFLSTLRNPTTLFFSFFFPFIFISIFGLLGGGSPKFDVLVRPESIQSGPLYEGLKKIEVLNFVTGKDNATIDDQLKKGQAPAAINIQENKSAEGPRIIVNLEESVAAGAQDYMTVSKILQSATSAGSQSTIALKEIPVEGRKLTQIDFMLPGQLAFALLSNAIFGIAMVFVAMRSELIIKRLFASPINRWSILMGEVVSRTIIAVLQAVIIIAAGHYIFGFTLANGLETFFSMLVLSIIGILVFLSMGLFVASIGKTQESLPPIANLMMMPQLFLSGAFFPIDLFPNYLQPIARVLPMTFLNDALRKVAFEGASLSSTLPQIGGLFVWALIFYALDAKLFKWE